VSSPIDPRAIVRAARARVKIIPGGPSVTPPPTPDNPDPQPVAVPPRVVIGPPSDTIPDLLKGPDGGLTLGAGLGMLWALFQSLEIRAVTGHLTLTAPPNGGPLWPAGQAAEKPITWDEPAPETPTGVLISAEAGILSAGKTVAVLKPGTATSTGATLVLQNLSGTAVAVNPANPITYNAQALYLYTPPLEVL
jgi:hypothetical protein